MKMRLLLAEDEKEMSAALVAILTHSGYEVDAVYDGQAPSIRPGTVVRLYDPGHHDAEKKTASRLCRKFGKKGI